MDLQGWTPVGDRALLYSVDAGSGATALALANRRALSIARAIDAAALEEVEEVVPGACTVLVVLRCGADVPPGLGDIVESCIESFEREVIEPAGGANGDSDRAIAGLATELHEVPVCYDGPDLDAVARLHSLSTDEVVRLHSGADYVVAVIGFSPGFPYLLGLPEALLTPRLATPRVRVPAGSVAIGGAFTGIYPNATPGGWHLIGRTELRLFDPHREPPSLLTPGDRVRFIRS
jgi:KipI family sensor histidine kinase inhibitor